MNVIAIANQEGGTAKTTTAAALGKLVQRALVDYFRAQLGASRRPS